MKELPTKINPKEYEEEIYKKWLKNNYFETNPNTNKTPYSIVIPPPNITGSLHMGHALNVTLQDILIRFHKLNGYETLWIPGMDHAGIATQNVVERKLLEKSIKKEDIGREKFIEEVWRWKEESGGTILNQLKRLGVACDWSKERFTMDEGLSKAVRIVFVHLFKEGLIYRSNYMVNWCPRCLTAISDLEVEYHEIKGKLYYIKYKLANNNNYLVIATTRPETILGDTAIAVNPKDERYKAYVGDYAVVPIIKRKIPIIADERVDKDFGTGALKITPAHDPVDFEIGKTHSLKEINIFDKEGYINENGGEFKSLYRTEARKKIVEKLKKENLIAKITDYEHNVGHCYRCRTQIEPRISLQWFVKMKPLAEEAVNAVKKGQIKIIPNNWEKTYFEWMYNIKDWCISRQIWWGHRIPVWYCKNCNKINVEVEKPTKCTYCGSNTLEQDLDVLDTWFSSALWPFSTMGWPENTPIFKKFYPTNCLVTGFDILFFWVARMIMMGLKFTKKVPFRNVYIHALVRDIEGNKMSKSRGNVIDPLTVIEKYSSDALRFTLTALAAQGRDIKLSEERIEGYRNFMNKIWNASRFVLMNKNIENKDIKDLINSIEIEDKWIISIFSKTAKKFSDYIKKYEFDLAAMTIYNFFWHTYCDWYIEITKYRIYKNIKKTEALTVATFILEKSLILLHPIMPFITEYIYNLLGTKESIFKENYPENIQTFDKEEEYTNKIFEIITMIRNIRGEYNIKPSIKLDAYIKYYNDKYNNIVNDKINIIKELAKVDNIYITNKDEKNAATSVSPDFQIFIPLKGVINIDMELKRLTKEKDKILKDYNLYGNKLKNKKYLENAPSAVIEKDKAKFNELNTKLERLNKTIEKLSLFINK
ncbi:MAG: valine--tRNA ligase [Deferribacterota bacterium]|nr:valine--tRNA ligase [Deferribacterota bacterium]